MFQYGKKILMLYQNHWEDFSLSHSFDLEFI